MDVKQRNQLRILVNKYIDSARFSREMIIALVVRECPVSYHSVDRHLRTLEDGKLLNEQEDGVIKWI